LIKLENNIILDLVNKTFREAQKESEFLGIKWAKAMFQLKQAEIKHQYDLIILKHHAKKRETTQSHADFEKLPDGVPLE